jgi:hypothetical protein
MATIANPADTERAERKFFFIMACVMALTIIAGFSTNLILGRSSFSLPLIYHVHAFVFMGWVALYLTQNGLIATDNVAIHRRLGWLAALWVPVMVGLGMTMTIVSARKGGRFFFDVNEFLFGNALQLLVFASLVTAAITLRRRTDWHRRLMYCSMAVLTGPGLGRMLPMPLFIPWAWWVVISASLIFPVIGMIADRRRRGRVHPAWLWGIGAVLAALLLGDLIAYSSIGLDATQAIVQGTPGADRPLHAYLP